MKQFVRVPYLFDSEEFQLFIRPRQEIFDLSNQPKLKPSEILVKLMPVYNLEGEPDSSALIPVYRQLFDFLAQCKKNLAFLEKFRDHIHKQEHQYQQHMEAENKLQNMFLEYEKQCSNDYQQVLQDKSISQINEIYEFDNKVDHKKKEEYENTYIKTENF